MSWMKVDIGLMPTQIFSLGIGSASFITLRNTRAPPEGWSLGMPRWAHPPIQELGFMYPEQNFMLPFFSD